jgi:hypothetical protein
MYKYWCAIILASEEDLELRTKPERILQFDACNANFLNNLQVHSKVEGNALWYGADLFKVRILEVHRPKRYNVRDITTTQTILPLVSVPQFTMLERSSIIPDPKKNVWETVGLKIGTISIVPSLIWQDIINAIQRIWPVLVGSHGKGAPRAQATPVAFWSSRFNATPSNPDHSMNLRLWFTGKDKDKKKKNDTYIPGTTFGFRFGRRKNVVHVYTLGNFVFSAEQIEEFNINIEGEQVDQDPNLLDDPSNRWPDY